MFRLKTIVIAGLLSVLPQVANGQYAPTIRSGRPGQAIGPFAVGQGVFQVQSGVDLSHSSSGDQSSDRSVVPGAVLRYGLSRRFELNAAAEYRRDEHSATGMSQVDAGLSRVAVGTRIHLADATEFRPSIGAQIGVRVPTSVSTDPSQHLEPGAMMIASRQVSDRAAVLLNAGVRWTGVDLAPVSVYVLNVGFALSERWSVFAENYGDRSQGDLQTRWDTGIAYVVDENLQLDVYTGIGRNGTLRDSFVSAGVSWRTAALRNDTQRSVMRAVRAPRSREDTR